MKNQVNAKAARSEFCQVVTMLLGMFSPSKGVPRFKSPLDFQFQIPANSHHGRYQVSSRLPTTPGFLALADPTTTVWGNWMMNQWMKNLLFSLFHSNTHTQVHI